MFYTIYRITNTTNGRYYIGQHQTQNLEDGYLGSGTYLKRAVAKHGRESFSKEILFVFDSFKDMDAKERELITKEVLDDPLCMNLAYGGSSGQFQRMYEEGVISPNKIRWSDPAQRQAQVIRSKAHFLRLRAEGKITGRKGSWAKAIKVWTGSRHTSITLRKMSESHQGELNSQFGSLWVVKNETNLKIPAEDLPQYLTNGWERGRYIPDSIKDNLRLMASNPTDGTRQRMSESAKKRNPPPSSKGKKVVNNGVRNRMVLPHEAEILVSEGWSWGALSKGPNKKP